MKSNILIYVDNLEYIDEYRKAGVSAFLFALDKFSVGYNSYTIDAIENVDVSNKYLLINRVLNCNDVDLLKELINKCNSIKGIVFEDISVYQIVKNMNLNLELICFQNHFCTNVGTVNFWLDRVDSAFICNELTYEELQYIALNAKKSVCMHLFGYNQVMYSRRLLVSNWCREFNVDYKNNMVIEDVATKTKFRAFENEFGTVMYSDKIFNGKKLLELNNIKYFYVNTMMIEHGIVMDFLYNIDSHFDDLEDDGYLNKETIYKLKERS